MQRRIQRATNSWPRFCVGHREARQSGVTFSLSKGRRYYSSRGDPRSSSLLLILPFPCFLGQHALSLSLSRSVFSSLFLFVPFFSSFLLPLLLLSFSLSFLSLLLLSLFFQIRLARVLSRHPETKKGDSYSQVIQNREKRPESVNFTPRGASGRRYSGHNLHPEFSFEKLDLSRGQDPVKNLPTLSS